MIEPDLSLPFAERQDDRVWDCVASFFHVPTQLSKGGLGLGCAVRARHAANYDCWADSLPMVRHRHPDVADTIIMGLERDPALCFGVRD